MYFLVTNEVQSPKLGDRHSTRLAIPSAPLRRALLLFYAIARAFQLYHGSDMIYETRKKPDPTLLLTQGIFNLPCHVGMV